MYNKPHDKAKHLFIVSNCAVSCPCSGCLINKWTLMPPYCQTLGDGDNLSIWIGSCNLSSFMKCERVYIQLFTSGKCLDDVRNRRLELFGRDDLVL